MYQNLILVNSTVFYPFGELTDIIKENDIIIHMHFSTNQKRLFVDNDAYINVYHHDAHPFTIHIIDQATEAKELELSKQRLLHYFQLSQDYILKAHNPNTIEIKAWMINSQNDELLRFLITNSRCALEKVANLKSTD